MSEDLVSRKALMEEISNSFSIPILKMNLKPEHMTIIKIEEIIRNMPTAYDKGKVAELEKKPYMTIYSRTRRGRYPKRRLYETENENRIV